jgi:hypothetical protein
MLHLLLLAAFTFEAPVQRTNTGAPVTTGTRVESQARDTIIRAGVYDLAITAGGGQMEATLEISYVRDSLKAVLKVGDHQSPVKPGARRGNKLALEPQSSALDVRYDLEFKGNELSGTFVYQGEPGTVTGKRRPGR